MSVKIFSEQDFPAYLPKLNALYDDLFSGGKGFRSQLIQIISKPLGVPKEVENLLSQTIEFIHNASLLHDDLIDRSQLRRGKPAAWAKYTPEYAVLAGDYLLARVMVNLSGHGNIKLVQFTSQTISDLLEGEWLQDSVVGDFFISVTQLDRIHNLKTGSLFKWCLKAPFKALEKYDKDLHIILDEMGTLLGQLFQRSDDLLDYDIRNDEGKVILGDLKSGYLNSFGAYVSNNMNRAAIDKMVKSKTMDDFYLVFSDDRIQGKEQFLKFVNHFDSENIQKIRLYDHYVDQLNVKLNEMNLNQIDIKNLITTLKSLTDLLYFRKRPA